MHRGEITGQFYDVPKIDIGMPFRSNTLTKKNDRKNISPMDDLLLPENNDKPCKTFEYYDPSVTEYAKDATIQPQITFDSRLEFDRTFRTTNGANGNTTKSVNHIQNISTYNTEYINNISINIYNKMCEMTPTNFCIFPLGIMSSLIENDPNIKKILSIINTNEIYHQLKILYNERTFLSRASIILAFNTEKINNTFSHYEDNENNLIEIPMNNPNFAIGFLRNKFNNNINLTLKLFMEYVLNLKHSNINVYCPSFQITNKLKLNNVLNSLKYIHPNSHDKISYFQIIHLAFQNSIYIKKSTICKPVDLSENFIFYIRYVPNNIILFIGQYNS
jgi:hypothetical protein